MPWSSTSHLYPTVFLQHKNMLERMALLCLCPSYWPPVLLPVSTTRSGTIGARAHPDNQPARLYSSATLRRPIANRMPPTQLCSLSATQFPPAPYAKHKLRIHACKWPSLVIDHPQSHIGLLQTPKKASSLTVMALLLLLRYMVEAFYHGRPD